MTVRRVLMTVDAVGGVWQYATDLAQALRPLDIEVMLAVLGPAPDAARRAAAEGIELIETGLPVDWLAEDEAAVATASRGIARLARESGVDLVHLNQPALAAWPMPAPTVAAIHSCVATWWDAVREGPMPDQFRWQTRAVARGLARAEAVIAPSRAFAEAVRRVYGLTEPPAVIHNGRAAAPAAAGAMHDFVITAGRLWDEGKNIAALDAAAARLPVPVKAAGSVDHPGGGRARFANLSLLGQMGSDRLAGLLSARPVFASTALYEPFGLAVLEAAQAGCALVLSDIPTFRELWDDVALFVHPRDPRAIAEALEDVLGDIPERIARGDRARQRAARFTPAAMAADVARTYASAATRAKAAA